MDSTALEVWSVKFEVRYIWAGSNTSVWTWNTCQKIFCLKVNGTQKLSFVFLKFVKRYGKTSENPLEKYYVNFSGKNKCVYLFSAFWVLTPEIISSKWAKNNKLFGSKQNKKSHFSNKHWYLIHKAFGWHMRCLRLVIL